MSETKDNPREAADRRSPYGRAETMAAYMRYRLTEVFYPIVLADFIAQRDRFIDWGLR